MKKDRPMPKKPPKKEHSSTYFVQDRSNKDERTRVLLQDQLVTASMGGVLPEQPDPTLFHRVLDVGCGTGGWLIEAARTYPTIKTLVGVDVSNTMVNYARAAAADQFGKQVQFETKDALLALAFPNDYFDLVNQRFGIGWLRTWEWKKILLEYYRVSRPSGIVRITEGHVTNERNSPALTTLCQISLETCHHAGLLFTGSTDGITSQLVRLLTQHGLKDVQSRLHTLVYRAGTVEHQWFYEDMLHLFHVALPFFHKWTRLPSDYQDIYQQALKEMRLPDFEAKYTVLTTWGNKPMDAQPM